MGKRIDVNRMYHQAFIVPAIGIMNECFGCYKYRIGFGWLNFRISIGFIQY